MFELIFLITVIRTTILVENQTKKGRQFDIPTCFILV